MKIGILTHYNVNNQGAQLQMIAMHHLLSSLGHEPVVLTYEKDFSFIPEEKLKNEVSLRSVPFYLKNYLFDKGLRLTLFNTLKVYKLKKFRSHLSFLPFNTDQIDAVIIGSDEVFSLDVGCNKMMYGHGLQAPAIAYAPAFGMTDERVLRKHNCYETVEKGLKSMYRLSARDIHTKTMIQTLTDREVPLVCDPVLLYNGSYNGQAKSIRKPYLLIYSYDRHMTDPQEIKAIKNYAKKHGLLTVSAGTYHKWCDKNITCNPKDWFEYFAKAECVLTDTFHGTVSSICNHAKFATFIRKSINAGKLSYLLQDMDLTDRELKEISESELERVLSLNIDYDHVDGKRAELINTSMNYLTTALEELHV